MQTVASKKVLVIALVIGGIGVPIATRTLLTPTVAKALSLVAIEPHQQEGLNPYLQDPYLQDSSLRNPQPATNRPIGQPFCLFNRQTRQAYISDASQSNRYTSPTGFQFDYPAGFVVEAKSFPGAEHNRLLEWIDLWTQQDYDNINSNVTPTELPPNVSVAVQPNPQQLALRDWVMQNDQFVLPNHFTSLTVAEQAAIAFQSTGLYEYENVVLANPVSSEVIVIKLDKNSSPEHNAIYRPVFQQIISNLRFSVQ